MEHLTSSITSSARASKNGGMAIPRVFCAVKEKFGDTVQYGRCYRTRGPRYVERRYYGDSYAYGRRAYIEPGYGYAQPGYGYGGGYYGGRPSVGFSFGTGRY